jgi:hypothetical protein
MEFQDYSRKSIKFLEKTVLEDFVQVSRYFGGIF